MKRSPATAVGMVKVNKIFLKPQLASALSQHRYKNRKKCLHIFYNSRSILKDIFYQFKSPFSVLEVNEALGGFRWNSGSLPQGKLRRFNAYFFQIEFKGQ